MNKIDDKLRNPRPFEPFLNPSEREELHGLLDFSGPTPPRFADSLRNLARSYVDDGDSTKLRAVCLLVADLFDQGWRVSLHKGALLCEPPSIDRHNDQTAEDVKLRIRAALQASRRRQLEEPSVARFIQRMERPTLRPQGRTSVLDLIDSGDHLADALERISLLPDQDREAAFGRVIDPVIEICHSGSRCAYTGLPLNDIWRYFRHTWAHEYRPIPGRQLLVLVRNAARPNRPVIGIAMLASPVMRLSARDNWIGWLRGAMEANLNSGIWDAPALAQAMAERLEASIADVRWDDLVTADEIASPVENTVLRLEQKASGAAFARELELRAHYEASMEQDGRVPPFRGAVKAASAGTNWRAASEDPLFVRKRAELLSQLLSAKQIFRAAGLLDRPKEALSQLLSAKSGQRAIDVVLTEFRKAGLSSRIVDVSICGAIAPYNELLGGKLVALLLASREVRDHYAERYGKQVSVIASQMAGRAVSKPADLRVLTTTSLYGVGSSQYNRLALRAVEHPGLDHDLRWDSIGKSRTGGFGTLHLGADTAHALRQMAQSAHASRRINNRFGEGTSPRLRQIREGLDAIGIDSDAILHHNTPRLFYACELGSGSRDSLMGMAGDEFHASPASTIAAAWRRRWLDGRVRRPETISALRTLGPATIQRSLHATEADLVSELID
ncbi:Druantia anti-phage system protein DruA [Nitrospirillum viridazoti]|uniref:Uncharacterized protein DUF4338 n=1 Tax=Nitrospirillum amazonense TaxID=28077 RepID=A0A560HRY5_9PROT|nr:Druantia anti-phage system protein DruA [Nitrospirillum amazonense]TWB48259.1 uncharacterized protein DUF4338 [Nitrospirillum amazonense]